MGLGLSVSFKKGMMSHKTRTQYIVQQDQREFDLAVNYLDRSHIVVKLNGIMAFYEWVSDSRIRLAQPAVSGSILLIQRVTPIVDPAVTFHNGSNLTEQELNRAVLQLLYQMQEQDDILRGSLDQAMVRLGDNLGVVTSPEAIVDELLRISELGDDLLNRFRDALSSIDLNAGEIIDQAFRLNNLAAVVDSLANLDDGTGLATVIQNEADQRVAGDTALANTLALIGAKSSDNLSFILDTNKVKASPSETLAQRFNAIYAANANALSLIQSEQNARVTADDALTSRLDTQGSRIGAAESAIVNESSTRATAIAAEASARQSLATKVNANEAAIQNEQSVRSNADTALAQTIAIMGAKNTNGTAFVLDMNKVQVGGGQSLATRMSGIDTSLGNNAAAVVAEQTARVNAVSALSQSLSTVQNTVNGHTASITSLTQVTNGLNLKQGISLNSNGHITGYVQHNNGAWGSFNVVADEFGVTAPNGGNPIKVFSVVAGKARFNANVEIYGNLLVSGTINNSKLTNDTVTGVEAAYNSGTINLTNSTPSRIHGLWINVEKSSSPVDIDFNSWATFTHNAGGSFTATVQLVRSRGETGGTVISSFQIYGSGMANDVWQGPIPVRFLDKPNGSGNWHYYVQIYFNVSNMTTQSVTARYGKLTELKNNTSSLGTGTGNGGGVGSGGGGSTGGGGGGFEPPDPGGGGGGGGEIEQPIIT
ncbi:phage tail fiber protein [Brevundimonas sp.]|uniref:phage tail fiber domain-containing protein n=1 Tax=Brevundimonas sp. TaxID=1871086 RepID=UPI002FCB1084